MKTLLTGGTGFIGSAVLRKLVGAGHDVRLLVRPGSDRRNLAGLRAEVVEGDLTNRRSLDRAARGCSLLFHLAADYRLWVPRPRTMYEINVEGTLNIMQAAALAGVRKIVYTSSVATLGLNKDGSPADERTPAVMEDMIGHYKRTKYLAEYEVGRMVREEHLPAVIVNPSTPVGPRDIKPTPTGRMIVDAASGRMPAYVNTGLNLVHVDDVAEGHLLALERGALGERYILGAANLSLKDILTEVALLTGRRVPRVRLSPWMVFPVAYIAEFLATVTKKGEPLVTTTGVRLARKKMYFSSEKAARQLGFSPRPVREGLKDAVEWFRKNGYLKDSSKF